MRLSFWQFLGLLVLAGLIWFLIYTWSPQQNTESWIDRMNSWFFKGEGEDSGSGGSDSTGAGGWEK